MLCLSGLMELRRRWGGEGSRRRGGAYQGVGASCVLRALNTENIAAIRAGPFIAGSFPDRSTQKRNRLLLAPVNKKRLVCSVKKNIRSFNKRYPRRNNTGVGPSGIRRETTTLQSSPLCSSCPSRRQVICDVRQLWERIMSERTGFGGGRTALSPE